MPLAFVPAFVPRFASDTTTLSLAVLTLVITFAVAGVVSFKKITN